jgi:putative DNA primase/helicase
MNANSRVIGSVAFVNFARAAFIVTVDPDDDDRRLFLPSKQNLGKRREGLAFYISEAILPGEDKEVIWAPYVKWEDTPVQMSADEAVAAMAGGIEARCARDEAKEFLLELLAEGPVPQKEIKIAAEGAGLGYRTVQRAKDSLGIKARREDFDGTHRWIWRLPCKDAKSAPKAATQNIGALGALGGENEGKDAKDAKDANFLAGGLDGESGGLDDPDFEERAAIREFDGGLSRTEAEAQAAEEMPDLPKFLDRRRRAGL